jgi:hypothetical protein
MPTRFYLHSAGTPAISPAFNAGGAGWDQTGQAVRLPMDVTAQQGSFTALANSANITIPITTTQQILCYQFVSNQVFRSGRMRSSDTMSMVLKCLESATTANAFLAYSLYAVEAASGGLITAFQSSMTNAGTEFAITTAATRIFNAVGALNTSALPVPWRMVLELGAHAQAPSAATTYTLRVGTNAASDFALTSALTTDLNPWMELSADLNNVHVGNYHAAKVGNGMSTGERIR